MSLLYPCAHNPDTIRLKEAGCTYLQRDEELEAAVDVGAVGVPAARVLGRLHKQRVAQKCALPSDKRTSKHNLILSNRSRSKIKTWMAMQPDQIRDDQAGMS